MTQKEAYDQLRDRWPTLFPWGENSLDSFRAYIRGKVPDAQQQAAFIELFGGPGPSMDTPGPDTTIGPDVSAYLSRIDALVGSVTALVGELQTVRAERADLEERLGALETAAKLLDQPGAEGVGSPPVPRVKAR